MKKQAVLYAALGMLVLFCAGVGCEDTAATDDCVISVDPCLYSEYMRSKEDYTPPPDGLEPCEEQVFFDCDEYEKIIVKDPSFAEIPSQPVDF